MNLRKILPRPLEIQPRGQLPDTCTLLLSLIMAAHLDRMDARRLGWRGVKPAGETALTCKVVNSPYIYGVAFQEEKSDAADTIKGVFNLYVFPESSSPLLETFPLSALSIAMGESYPELIRDFENNLELLSPFIAGQLSLTAPMSGNALFITLESWVKFRVISQNGINVNGDWLVKPGTPEADFPAFHLLWPLFTAISRTGAVILEEKPHIFFSSRECAGYLIDGSGNLLENSAETLNKVSVISEYISEYSPHLQEFAHLKPLSSEIINLANDNQEYGELPILHILTGFLGAGKTTFLKQWLEFLHGRERFTGVIQNEFGPVDLDSELLRSDTVVEALDDGCVCCSLADSLRPGLARILAEMPAHQFILETTGVGNPANIRSELQNLADIVNTGLTICIADAADLFTTGLPHGGFIFDQLRFSDVIVLNKLDLLPEGISRKEALEKLNADLLHINPEAIVLPAVNGAIPFALLDTLPPARSAARFIKSGTFLTHMNAGFEKAGVYFNEPVTRETLEQLFHEESRDVARAKGVVEIKDVGPCIIQYVPGDLRIIPSSHLKPAGLSIIGKNLSIPANLLAAQEETI